MSAAYVDCFHYNFSQSKLWTYLLCSWIQGWVRVCGV